MNDVPRELTIPNNIIKHLEKLEAKKEANKPPTQQPQQNAWTGRGGGNMAGRGRGRGPTRPYGNAQSDKQQKHAEDAITIGTNASTFEEMEQKISALEANHEENTQRFDKLVMYVNNRFRRVQAVANQDRAKQIVHNSDQIHERRKTIEATKTALSKIENQHQHINSAIIEQRTNLVQTRSEISQRNNEQQNNINQLNSMANLPPQAFSPPINPEQIDTQSVNRTLKASLKSFTEEFGENTSHQTNTEEDQPEGIDSDTLMAFLKNMEEVMNAEIDSDSGSDSESVDNNPNREEFYAQNKNKNSDMEEDKDNPNDDKEGPRESMDEGDGSEIT